MPRGLTEAQQEHAKKVFAELHALHKRQGIPAQKLGISQGHFSSVISDGKISLQLLFKAEDALAEARSKFVQSSDMQDFGDVRLSKLLMAADRLPGMRRWVEDNRERLGVRDFMSVIEAYDKNPPPLGPNGQPLGDWSRFLDRVFSGQRTDATEGDEAASPQLPPESK